MINLLPPNWMVSQPDWIKTYYPLVYKQYEGLTWCHSCAKVTEEVFKLVHPKWDVCRECLAFNNYKVIKTEYRELFRWQAINQHLDLKVIPIKPWKHFFGYYR
jgi:hypothetical protein